MLLCPVVLKAHVEKHRQFHLDIKTSLPILPVAVTDSGSPKDVKGVVVVGERLL